MKEGENPKEIKQTERRKKEDVRLNQSDWNGCVAVCCMELGSKTQKKVFRTEQVVYVLSGLGRIHWLIA